MVVMGPINLIIRFAAWVIRHWITLLVIFAPVFLPVNLLSLGNPDVAHVLSTSAYSTTTLCVALAGVFSTRVQKWQIGIGVVFSCLEFYNLWASPAYTMPLPAATIGHIVPSATPAAVVGLAGPWSMYWALALFIAGAGIAAWVMYLPTGAAMVRVRNDLSTLTSALKTSDNHAHGSARWMRPAEAMTYFTRAAAFVVGVVKNTLLYDARDGHVLVVGPAGSRKTTNFVVPTALSWPSSLVVLDPKGEVAYITARRRREMGQRVVIFDHMRSDTDYANALDWLSPANITFQTDVASVAAMLYEAKNESGSEAGEFFKATGRMLIEWTIFTQFRPDATTTPTLRGVRKLIAAPANELRTALKSAITDARKARAEMTREELDSPVGRLWAALEDRAGSIAENDTRTFTNILVSANAETKWLADPMLADIVSGGPEHRDVDASRMVTSDLILEGNLTVYCCVSPQVLVANPSFARLLVTTFMQRIVGKQYRQKDTVLFLLDEAPRLGPAEVLLKIGLDVSRGYGARLAYVCQSLGQIEQVFGQAGLRNWLSSTPLKLILGCGDDRTAELISKMCGETTVIADGSSSGPGTYGSSTSLVKRPLITVGEALKLPPEQALVLPAGQYPIIVDKPFYKTRPEFAGQFDDNPYEKVA